MNPVKETAATDIALIRSIYDSFGRGDYDSVLTYFADDIEWFAADNSPLADRSPYKGKDEIRRGVFDRIEAGFEKLQVLPDEIFAAEGRVVVLGYYLGMFRGKESDFRTQVAHIWTVRNGRAAKFQQYLDTLKVANDANA